MKSWISRSVALALALAGCDGGPPPLRVPGDEVLTFDAAMIGYDGGRAVPARDGGPADAALDAGETPGVARGFHPDVPATHVGHESWEGLSLQALNIVPSETGRITQIYTVIRNDDPTLALCNLTLDIDVMDDAGSQIAFLGLTVDGEPWIDTIVSSCIPPRGGLGIGYGNASGVLDLSRVAELRYVWFGYGSETARPTHAIRNEGARIVAPYGGDTHWAVEGQLEVVEGRVRAPQVTVMPIVDGLPVNELIHIELGNFSAGQRIDYQTTAHEGLFTTYLSSVRYREPPSITVDSPEAPAEREARERHDQRREAQRALRARL